MHIQSWIAIRIVEQQVIHRSEAHDVHLDTSVAKRNRKFSRLFDRHLAIPLSMHDQRSSPLLTGNVPTRRFSRRYHAGVGSRIDSTVPPIQSFVGLDALRDLSEDMHASVQ